MTNDNTQELNYTEILSTDITTDFKPNVHNCPLFNIVFNFERTRNILQFVLPDMNFNLLNKSTKDYLITTKIHLNSNYFDKQTLYSIELMFHEYSRK